MEGKAPTRQLVKTRLTPWIYAALATYAEQTHRSISSAAEHLIALGLERDGYNVDSTQTARDQSVTTDPDSAGH